ncbi:MAG: O-antigen ligase family protein [Bacteroidetes bacterium]|nr:O-antigen ligase family protein [Bacteroidota bacterium]
MLQRTLKKYDISASSYLGLILIHVGIGVGVYLFEPLSKLYYFAFLGFFFFKILKNRNRNQEILMACAYIVGSEVFMRMTGGAIFYEAAKYEIIAFCGLGLFMEGFKRDGAVYFLYLLLLAPGIVISSETLNMDTNIRTAIAFNLSGPVCLGVAALYAYKKPVSRQQLHWIALAGLLPIISMGVYLYLYTPDLRDVITGTESNFAASGGFGPNQVATILGLGIFLAYSRILFHSQNKLLLGVNIFIFVLLAYRGLVTFSRGGMIVGIFMISLLVFSTYKRIDFYNKQKMTFLLIVFSGIALGTWLYSSYQTSGLLELRYAGKDAAGRTSGDYGTGRAALFQTEFKAFLENPLFGIGVGKNKEYREENFGVESASHNEVSRLLAEHGTAGILSLFILIFTPLLLRIRHRNNLMFLPFLAFWFLTINHSSMRLAAPAFVYALVLLHIYYDKNSVYRQPTG